MYVSMFLLIHLFLLPCICVYYVRIYIYIYTGCGRKYGIIFKTFFLVRLVKFLKKCNKSKLFMINSII